VETCSCRQRIVTQKKDTSVPPATHSTTLIIIVVRFPLLVSATSGFRSNITQRNVIQTLCFHSIGHRLNDFAALKALRLAFYDFNICVESLPSVCDRFRRVLPPIPVRYESRQDFRRVPSKRRIHLFVGRAQFGSWCYLVSSANLSHTCDKSYPLPSHLPLSNVLPRIVYSLLMSSNGSESNFMLVRSCALSPSPARISVSTRPARPFSGMAEM